ncbi:MAG: HEAT repeat domain-containing protein [Anaerolineae bacterium]|nr:HEAT repeat domain-containing protein [Anaerolineae bacterium]
MPLNRTVLPNLTPTLNRLSSHLKTIRQAFTRTVARQRLVLPAERRNLRAALVALRTGSPRERWEAAAALGHFPASPDVAGALAAALGDPEPFVRAEAAAALAQLGAPAARGPLLQALGSQEPLRVAAAAEGLGRLRDAESVGALLAALETTEPAVRASIVTALGQTGAAEALPALLAALNDDVPAVRWAAAGALGQLGHAEASSALATRLAASVRRREDPDPARRGRRRRIEEPFVKEPVMMRRRLVWSLSRAGGGSEAVAALVRALDDVDAEVRRRAALALGKIGDATALPALGAHLDDVGDEGGGPVAEAAQAAIVALEARLAPAPAAEPPQDTV